MRLCIDCKHHEWNLNEQVHYCVRFAEDDISPVTGYIERIGMKMCRLERENGYPHLCGAMGAYYEEKER